MDWPCHHRPRWAFFSCFCPIRWQQKGEFRFGSEIEIEMEEDRVVGGGCGRGIIVFFDYLPSTNCQSVSVSIYLSR